MWKSGKSASFKRLSSSNVDLSRSKSYQNLGSSRMSISSRSSQPNINRTLDYQQPPTPKISEIVPPSRKVSVSSGELRQEAGLLDNPGYFGNIRGTMNAFRKSTSNVSIGGKNNWTTFGDDVPLKRASSVSIYKPTESVTLSRNSSIYASTRGLPGGLKGLPKNVKAKSVTIEDELKGLPANVKAKSVTIDDGPTVSSSKSSLKTDNVKGSKGIGKVTGAAGGFFALDMLDGQAGNDDPSNNPQKYTGETLEERRNKMEEANAQYWSDIANNWSLPESVRSEAQAMLDSLLAERVPT